MKATPGNSTALKIHTRVKLTAGNKTIITKGLVDTGNSVRNDVAISDKLAKEMGLRIVGTGTRRVGTAGRGSKLKCQGEAQLSMKIEGIKKSFEVRAIIIQDLSADLNIGGYFLSKNRMTLDYSTPTPQLRAVDDSSELIQDMRQETTSTTAEHPRKTLIKSECTNSNINLSNASKTDLPLNRGDKVSKANLGRLSKEPKQKETGGDALPDSKLSVKKAEHVEVLSELGAIPLRLKKHLTIRQASMITARIPVPATDLDEVLISVHHEQEQSNLKICPGIYKVYRDQKGQCSVAIVLVNKSQQNMKIREGTIVANVARVEGTKFQVQRKGCPTDQSKEKINNMNEDSADFQALLKDLKIEDNQILNQHPKSKKRLKRILKRHIRTFNTEEKFGDAGADEECKIRLKPGTQPVKQRVRPLNPAQEKVLRDQVQEWLAAGIIEPSKSSWASPTVLVKKKTGDWRLCIDFRRLNEATIGDSFPLPGIQHLLQRAAGHNYYSALDGSNAYLTIRMEEESMNLTAFVCPDGLFHFRKMPFGLKNAGATYSRFIATVLARLGDKHINVYLDDVLVFGKTLEEHITRLEEVIAAHEEAGVKINSKKTVLVTSSVDYLGHRLSKTGISTIPEYIERILDWPEPSTPRQVAGLLGFLSYYREFIPNFSELTAAMAAEKKKKKINWTEEMSKNLKTLKEKFKTAPIRAAPDFNSDEEFILTTDYSGKAISAILSQVQGGQERLISAGGRKTTGPESRYSSWKGELSALVHGCRKYEHILKYRRFQVVTDATGLKYLHSLKSPKGMAGRWIDELASFEFQIQHRPGRLNLNADSLSRADHLPPPTEEEELEQQEWLSELSPEDLQEEQLKDPVLQEVRRWVVAGQPPTREEMKGKTREYFQYRNIFSTIKANPDGLLVCESSINGFDNDKVTRVLVPESRQGEAYQWTHEHRSAGHFGQAGTYARAIRRFYYPGMHTDLKIRVKNCAKCIQKITKSNQKDTVHVPRRAGFPGETIYIDLIGPYHATSEGYKYGLSVECGFTRFAQCFLLRTKEATEVARVLMDKYISTFGCPQAIHSDAGTEFTAKVFTSLMEQLQIKKKTQPPYNPWANKVERLHRVINAALRTMCDRDDLSWVRYLPAIILAYNTKVSATTGVSPFMAMFGRPAKLPVDLVLALPREDNTSVHEFVQTTVRRFQLIYRYMLKNDETRIERNSTQYTGQTREYTVGEKVWYLSPRRVLGKPAKHTSAWTGPWRVTGRVAEVLIKIAPANQGGREQTVHISRIRNYNGPELGRIPATVLADQTQEVSAEDDDDLGVRSSAQPLLGVPVRTETEGRPILDLAEARRDPLEEPMQEGGGPSIDLGQDKLPDEVMEEPGSSDTVSGTAVEESPDQDMTKQLVQPEQIVLPSDDAEMTDSTTSRSSRSRRGAVRKRQPPTTDTSTDRVERPRHKRQVVKFQHLLSSTESGSSSSDESMAVLVPMLVGSNKPAQTSVGASYDLKSSESVVLAPGTVRSVDINLSLAIPTGYCLQLSSRREGAKKGIFTIPGVIDSKYQGRVKILLFNTNQTQTNIETGETVGTGILLKHHEAQFKETAHLEARIPHTDC